MLNLLAVNEAVQMGSFMFILGLCVVFGGMIIIITVISIIGKILNSKNKQTEPKIKEIQPVQQKIVNVEQSNEEIPDHIKAAIVASITAYYFNESSSKCEFVVKKIKRI